jgi:hypothetical protein
MQFCQYGETKVRPVFCEGLFHFPGISGAQELG